MKIRIQHMFNGNPTGREETRCPRTMDGISRMIYAHQGVSGHGCRVWARRLDIERIGGTARANGTWFGYTTDGYPVEGWLESESR